MYASSRCPEDPDGRRECEGSSTCWAQAWPIAHWEIPPPPRSQRRERACVSCDGSPGRRVVFWLLLLPARKAGGLVDAAAAFVDGDLRVGAERTRAIDSSAGRVRCLDLVRSFLRLDPLLQGGDHVERVRSLAAAAVPHSWGEKEPV